MGAEENATKVQMEEVFEFEKKLAEIYEPKEKLRINKDVYHKMKMEDLQQLAPAVSIVPSLDLRHIHTI